MKVPTPTTEVDGSWESAVYLTRTLSGYASFSCREIDGDELRQMN